MIKYQGLITLYRNRNSIMLDMKDVKKRILTNLAVTFPEFEKITDPLSCIRSVINSKKLKITS